MIGGVVRRVLIGRGHGNRLTTISGGVDGAKRVAQRGDAIQGEIEPLQVGVEMGDRIIGGEDFGERRGRIGLHARVLTHPAEMRFTLTSEILAGLPVGADQQRDRRLHGQRVHDMGRWRLDLGEPGIQFPASGSGETKDRAVRTVDPFDIDRDDVPLLRQPVERCVHLPERQWLGTGESLVMLALEVVAVTIARGEQPHQDVGSGHGITIHTVNSRSQAQFSDFSVRYTDFVNISDAMCWRCSRSRWATAAWSALGREGKGVGFRGPTRDGVADSQLRPLVPFGTHDDPRRPRANVSHDRYTAFEGAEGCGKSTQAARYAESIGALLTRETGGTPIGGRLREILHDTSVHNMAPRAEALIAAADRAQHIDEVVRPALEAGRTVVSDRSVYSTLAYQGHGRQLDVARVRDVNEWATGGLWPDVVVFLDTPDDVIAERMSRRNLDRFEAAGREFHDRVIEGFREMAAADPQRWITVSAVGSIGDVAAQIDAALAAHDGSA